MTTTHHIHIGQAQNMQQVQDNSVALVVTSPPYPMIEMWDEILSNQNNKVANALDKGEGNTAFELMHQELDKVWKEVNRVLINGGIACINIGDATRTINGNFALYPNHSRIIEAFLKLGMVNLPNIIWRKQTNAPNKFMGSGMLPAGAYVTLEHEWILVFRKGTKREFKTETEKQNRRASAFFWEERNQWFSDVWDFKGTKQKVSNSQSRTRSAAYPFELPYRLINMYSVQGDTVLDPFLGTGTTSLAAIASARNSVGYEIDKNFKSIIVENIKTTPKSFYKSLLKQRSKDHNSFIKKRIQEKGEESVKHYNTALKTKVMTKQEKEIIFKEVQTLDITENVIKANYSPFS